MYTLNEKRQRTEESRVSELHRLYRYILNKGAEITDIQESEPNVFHITLGWWQYEGLDQHLYGTKEDYRFWASRVIILRPQLCKISEQVLLKLGWKV